MTFDIGHTRESIIRFTKVDYMHSSGVTALSNVSLEIKKGELVAILGANGAGKSTLVRHINGLLKPTHGEVEVFGVNTKQTTPARLSKKVGIVFQNPNNQLFAESVRAEVEFGLRNFDVSQINERTDWALKTFSLDQYANRPPMELSGGEKKRLCTALVLAWDPEILILDEPTVGQDNDQKDALSENIRMLLSQEKTVILVTHDVEFVWPLQPRVILMSEGKIIADGACSETLGNSSVAASSRVIPPQLVELFSILSPGEGTPKDVFEARDKILKIAKI
ncbi:MAG: energy-coupling factor ABC transporter ATP-binding protein [Nitrososphaerales archaeon]